MPKWGEHHVENQKAMKITPQIWASKRDIPMQGRYVNDVVAELASEYSVSNVDTRQGNHTSAAY